jgi:DNA topoisomerase-1
MSKSLVIVESPAKEKTIGKILGKDFIVKSSMGHIKDLPSKKMGVDIEHGFKPEYVVIPKKNKKITELKTAAKSADEIYIATDPDREGEAIGWHIADELRVLNKPIHRVAFNEITQSAVREAIQNPMELDEKKYNAQQARRILDRLVGFDISPILWRTILRGLSAGRVQSVAVRLICEREEEIQKFSSQEYWSIIARLKAETRIFESKLIRIGSEKVGSPLEKNAKIIKNKIAADKILKDLEQEAFIVEEISKKKQLRQPAAPFITSTLQQDASRKLGFSTSKTMRIAQELYEGVELGDEGSVGLISYMRTDSTRISNEAIEMVRGYIKEKFGPDYLPDAPKVFTRKKGKIQDAHEAIRPTSIQRDPETIKKYLSSDQKKLYELIWQRFTACQMKPAVLDVTTADIKAGQYTFRSTGSVISFPGFLKVYIEANEDETDTSIHEGENEGILPDLKEKQKVDLDSILPKQHFTEPPPRYNEATLVKELEEKGIGRPSTYATIIDTIQKRYYVLKFEKRFYPTILGQVVTKLLIASFPDIMEVRFTAHMEDDLDDIEEGKMDWVDALQEFYSPFSGLLDSAPDIIRENKKVLLMIKSIPCEKCGKPMAVRFGNDGNVFLGCSGYPECKNILPISQCERCKKPVTLKALAEQEWVPVCSSYTQCEEKPLDSQNMKIKSNVPEEKVPSKKMGTCPKCQSDLVERKGPYGVFIACSNYPKCKYIQPEVTGVKCPECGGDIVARMSKRGKFYGCSNYPECKFILSYKPINQVCPECQNPFLLMVTKKDKTIIKCAKKECGYSKDIKE